MDWYQETRGNRLPDFDGTFDSVSSLHLSVLENPITNCATNEEFVNKDSMSCSRKVERETSSNHNDREKLVDRSFRQERHLGENSFKIYDSMTHSSSFDQNTTISSLHLSVFENNECSISNVEQIDSESFNGLDGSPECDVGIDALQLLNPCIENQAGDVSPIVEQSDNESVYDPNMLPECDSVVLSNSCSTPKIRSRPNSTAKSDIEKRADSEALYSSLNESPMGSVSDLSCLNNMNPGEPCNCLDRSESQPTVMSALCSLAGELVKFTYLLSIRMPAVMVYNVVADMLRKND